jgi:hypothetical protein
MNHILHHLVFKGSFLYCDILPLNKGFIVLNATFNNISVIAWLSVLLVDETGVPGEKHRPVASH